MMFYLVLPLLGCQLLRLTAAGGINEQCFENQTCAIAHSVCINYRCECEKMYTIVRDEAGYARCVKCLDVDQAEAEAPAENTGPSGLAGETCMQSSSCKFRGSECINKHCECPTGYTIFHESARVEKCVKCKGIESEAPTAKGKDFSECGTAAVPPSINLAPVSKHRIVGGAVARFCSFPYQVFIMYQKAGSRTASTCGGSIYDKRHIITAAHCIPVEAAAEGFTVTIGVNARNDTKAQRIVGEKVVSHEQYSHKTVVNDIAIIRLSKDIQFGECARPICLATSDVPAGTMCAITGWGTLAHGSKDIPNNLHQVAMPMVDPVVCFDKTHHNKPVQPNALCAGFDEGKQDSCQGDSGGPLACLGTDGKFYLHGVTSYGEKCAQRNRPGIYTRIASYLDWIAKNTK